MTTKASRTNLFLGAIAMLVSAAALVLIFGYLGLETARTEAHTRRAEARLLRRELRQAKGQFVRIGHDIAALEAALTKPVPVTPPVVVTAPVVKKPTVKKPPKLPPKQCLDLDFDPNKAWDKNALTSKC